jgi:hypothetical protein
MTDTKQIPLGTGVLWPAPDDPRNNSTTYDELLDGAADAAGATATRLANANVPTARTRQPVTQPRPRPNTASEPRDRSRPVMTVPLQ